MNFCQSKCYTLRQNFDCEKVSQHVEVYHADSSRGPIRGQQMDGYGKFHFLPFFHVGTGMNCDFTLQSN